MIRNQRSVLVMQRCSSGVPATPATVSSVMRTGTNTYRWTLSTALLSNVENVSPSSFVHAAAAGTANSGTSGNSYIDVETGSEVAAGQAYSMTGAVEAGGLSISTAGGTIAGPSIVSVVHSGTNDLIWTFSENHDNNPELPSYNVDPGGGYEEGIALVGTTANAVTIGFTSPTSAGKSYIYSPVGITFPSGGYLPSSTGTTA